MGFFKHYIDVLVNIQFNLHYSVVQSDKCQQFLATL